MQKVSVVMPSFNDGKNIGNELNKLSKIGIDEIIVVDDGSIDNTSQVVSQASNKNKRIRLVTHKTNRGKGAAMRTGAKAAKNDTLVFVDADGQFDVSEIPGLVTKMKNVDMVVGSRNFGNIPLSRRMTNKAANVAIYLGTGHKVEDALSGFRVMHRKDFLDLGLKKNHYEVESEINYRALRKNMKVAYVPVTVRYGSTSKITLKQGLLISSFLIKIALRLA